MSAKKVSKRDSKEKSMVESIPAENVSEDPEAVRPKKVKKRKEVEEVVEEEQQIDPVPVSVPVPAKKKKALASQVVEEVADDEEKKDDSFSEVRPSKRGSLRKCFYKAPESLASFSEAEVDAYREEQGMSVAGSGSQFPNFKPARKFAESGLPKNVLQICAAFDRPTPIQAQAWPIALSGRDSVGIAETGSGKTLAFTLPGVVHILDQAAINPKRPELRGPVMLVLAPTRELAMQIAEVTDRASAVLGLTSLVIYGGVPYPAQAASVRSGCHILVATPGRLLGMLEANDISLTRVTFLVLDEADRMLDMGFINDMRNIVAAIPSPERQTLMFSATWPPEVQKLASEFLKDPVKITIGSDDLAANVRITQHVEVCDRAAKDGKLDALLHKYHKKGNKIIIFCLYKMEAARVEGFLQRKGWKAAAIHGDKGQVERTAALAAFKNGSVPLLVATDVAARGLDIPNVEYVINYTFPLTIEDYVHRIGRTGRAGKTGISHTFFTSDDKAHSGSLVNVLKDANQVVPEELMAFGVHTKKKVHAIYGNHFKESAGPIPAATKIKFDD